MSTQITPDNSSEQLTDKMIKHAKTNSGQFSVSDDPSTQDLLKLVRDLNNLPKTIVPMANYERVKQQVIDRISMPALEKTSSLSGFFQYIPNFIKIGGAVVGTFLILISLTIGTAIAAIQSVPGQPIYPLKKVVENIQLRLANDEQDKVALEIKFANNRLEELETVLMQSQEGKVSSDSVQKLVEKTVRDVSNTASRVSQNSKTEPSQAQILSKLVDLSAKQTNLLQAASIYSEGEIKLELEKALETSIANQEQTFEDIEKAGLKIENNIIIADETPSQDKVEASGKITLVRKDAINIGTAKFLLTDETKFVNMNREDLDEDQIVSIKAVIVGTETNALEVELKEVTSIPEETETTPPPPPAPTPTEEPTTIDVDGQ